MNIQRYTWPVIVAAGLHGALFLMTPDRSVTIEKPAIRKEPPLPPLPVETIAMVDSTDSSDDAPAVGGALVPDIPEVPLDSLEKPEFTVTKTENIRPETATTILPSNFGPGGPECTGGPSIPRFFKADGLDRHPRATAQISPDYPATLHQQGISGSVTVEFDVDTLGRVVRAEAINCTRREFAEPALRAVRNWRFEPGKRNGKVVPFRMTIPIEFKIDS